MMIVAVRAGLLAAMLTLITATAAWADPAPRPFCADRPGKATPPCILEQGRLQLETGLFDRTVQKDAGVHDTLDAWGGLELRAGLTRRVEAALSWSPYLVEHQHGVGAATKRSGVGDLGAAFRVSITDPDASGLGAAIQPFVTAPTGSHGQGAGGWQGGLRAPIAGQFTSDISFAFTPEVDVLRDASSHGTHLAFAGAAGLGRGVGPVTLGVEIWGLADQDRSGHTYQASADLTAAWMVGEDVQIDAGLNHGLTADTPDLEVYLGVSRRF